MSTAYQTYSSTTAISAEEIQAWLSARAVHYQLAIILSIAEQR